MQPGKQDANVEARSGPAGLHGKAGSLVHTAVAASVPTAAAAQAAAAGAAVLGQRMKLTSKRNFRRKPCSNALSQLPYQLQSPGAHRQCATRHVPASIVGGRLSMVDGRKTGQVGPQQRRTTQAAAVRLSAEETCGAREWWRAGGMCVLRGACPAGSTGENEEEMWQTIQAATV